MAAAASRLATKTDGQDSIRRTGSANTAAAALNPDSSTNSSRRPKTKPGCCPATVRSNEVTTPIAKLRADLNRYNSREIDRKPSVVPQTQSAKTRDHEFAARAQALFAPLNSNGIRI